ncbi:MAG TPA: HlyD family type I secretion periplasmic adaptor subunit [Burkholderiales bacterium]|nr:HlyD family type I secretion periplasmic adaptor subunit [Burkholderiales bacterium]
MSARTLDQALDARPVWRSGVAVIVLATAAVSAWATLAPLTGAIIAPGFVKVDLNRKIVQHLEGGTVRAIRVRDGDRVAQGQELVLLDDVRIDAQLDLLRTQLDGERVKAARLEAERAYATRPAFPPEILKRKDDPKTAEILGRETTLFRARRDALETQIAVLRRQIQETVGEIAALTEQLDAEARALKLQKEELAANQRLLEQGYVQKTRVLTLQRAVAEYEARHGEHRAELAKARQRTQELELRILSMRNQYAQSAADELKESSARIFDLEERIRPSRDASERQRITAPIAGEVVGLRVFTAGSVVGPRDVLMEIVPDEKRLIVEARIRPEDINHVRAGIAADVRLTAFQQRTTPLVEGTVSYVSGDRLVDPQTGAAYYTVNVDVPQQKLTEANLRLQAGMPAEIFIRTDERTTLDYLLAPVTSYLRRSMREPL